MRQVLATLAALTIAAAALMSPPGLAGAAGGSGGAPAPAPAVAAEGRVEKAIARLLAAPHADPSWFAPAFLAQVPAASLDGPLATLRQGLGALHAVVAAGADSGAGFRADFEHGSIPVDAAVDQDGRFTRLFLHPPDLLPATVDDAVKRFSALPGQVALLALVDGKPRAALAPDLPLAVGSTFKLAVLAALRADVARGRRGWADVVTLEDRWRSLPSGVLQTWPTGSHFTLETLAGAMISISDNTAADALAGIVGRDAVEKHAPARVRPFLTTREAFVLKAPASASLLARWRRTDEAGRRALLAEIDAQPLPRWWEPAAPADLDIEWHFTPRELCALMAEVEDLPLMTINPGIGVPRPGDRVAYKGGSEPGVIDMTVAVRRGARRICVAATWNDRAHEVETMRMLLAVRGLVAALLR